MTVKPKRSGLTAVRQRMNVLGDPSAEVAPMGDGQRCWSLLYLFLYAPIAYVVYASFSEDIVWPFPPSFTLTAYEDLFDNSLYADALFNSLTLGIGSGILSTLIATAAVIGDPALSVPAPHLGLSRLSVAALRRRASDRHLLACLQCARAGPARQHVLGDRGECGRGRCLLLPHPPCPVGAL